MFISNNMSVHPIGYSSDDRMDKKEHNLGTMSNVFFTTCSNERGQLQIAITEERGGLNSDTNPNCVTSVHSQIHWSQLGS